MPAAMPATSSAEAIPPCRNRLSGGRELAVLLAVAEVDHYPDDEPARQTQPVRPAEAVDHRTADDHPGRCDQRDGRHLEAAFEVRTLTAHQPHARAHEDEGEQRADAGHFPH